MKKTKAADDKIQIHIVSSVKGGCGKTAFSLFKAMDAALEIRNEDLNNKRAKVLWIDADFKGTASRTLLYSKDEKQFEAIHGLNTIDKLKEEIPTLFAESPLPTRNSLCYGKDYVPYTINDYLCEEIQGLEKMIVHGYIYSKQKIGGRPASTALAQKGCINGIIDFIFSSGTMLGKRVFNYGSGLPTIEIGRFTYLMRALLLRLCEKGVTKTKAAGEKNNSRFNYKHIIIDMPPGDDAYSSALLGTIRKLAQEREDRVEIHFYALATSDRGHMDAMLESVQDTCERLRGYKHKEKIHIVLSEVRSGEFNSIGLYKDLIDLRCNKIHEQFPDEDIAIDVLLCKFQEEYCKFCRDIDQKEFAYSIQGV